MSPPVAKIRLLMAGFLDRKGDVVVDASSNVALIEAFGKRVIVDTGSPRDWDKLRAALRSAAIPPGSVDHVVNTHLHIDHCGCNDMFEKALSHAHELESPPAVTRKIASRTALLPQIELVPTPGHTPGSISVFVQAEKRYAICGDAIPTRQNFESHVPPFIAFDKALALRSLELIASWAEVVIPGHDTPFQVERKLLDR